MSETEYLERELRKSARLLTSREAIETLAVRRVEELLTPYKWERPKRPRADRRKVTETETCVIHLSDLQIGKRTESYNFQIAAARMELLAEKIRKIVSNRKTSAKIQKCVIMIGGDIVEGETIFSHQPWTVDGDLWEQAVRQGPKILADFIINMSEVFRHVSVHSVPGNHGRSAPKNSSASPRTNFDNITGVITRLVVSQVIKDDRITWDVDHDSFYRIIPVESHNVLLVHGDQIAGGGGIGGYPLTGLAKKIAGWGGSLPEKWDTIFLGHFHRPMAGVVQGKMFYANGTTESDNDFALEVIGEAGRPCQRVVFFNKEHGPIADSLVWLD